MATLLDDIEAFLKRHPMSATAFGDSALGDRHFVRQLRKGRRVWPETEKKVRAFMAAEGAGAVPSCATQEAPPPFPNPSHGTVQTAPEPIATPTGNPLRKAPEASSSASHSPANSSKQPDVCSTTEAVAA